MPRKLSNPCPMGGQLNGGYQDGGYYAPCPECGRETYRTGPGVVRPHNRPRLSPPRGPETMTRTMKPETIARRARERRAERVRGLPEMIQRREEMARRDNDPEWRAHWLAAADKLRAELTTPTED